MKKHRWLFWAAPGVLLLGLLAVLLLTSDRSSAAEIPTVENPAFSLNGADYSAYPTLQDFELRGWKANNSYSYHGGWDEITEQPVDLFISGVGLRSGDCSAYVYFNHEDRINELSLSESRIKTLSVYGSTIDGKIESLIVDGVDLSKVTREQLTSLWGEPDRVDGPRSCFYIRKAREYGFTMFHFSFPSASAPVQQIMFSFDTDDAS